MIRLTDFPTAELNQENTFYITIAQKQEVTSVDFNKESTKLRSNLLTVSKAVEENCEGDVKEKLLERIEEVRQNFPRLVSHRGALVLYLTPEESYYYKLALLSEEVAELDTFPHVKPLVENFQFSNEYDLLVLNKGDIRFFEGDASDISEVSFSEDKDAPVDMLTALGTELVGGNLSHSTNSEIGGYHGHRETSNEKAIDRVNYFRIVDKYIDQHYSSKNKKPLILYALPENQAVFRDISKNAYLLDEGIEESGASVDIKTLAAKATDFNKELVLDEQAALLERFAESNMKFKIIDHWDDLAAAALEGKISELVIRDDFTMTGHIDENGRYDASGDGFLSELVLQVLRTAGHVFVMDENRLPDGINVSARLRY